MPQLIDINSSHEKDICQKGNVQCFISPVLVISIFLAKIFSNLSQNRQKTCHMKRMKLSIFVLHCVLLFSCIDCGPAKVYNVKFEVNDDLEIEEFYVKAKAKKDFSFYPGYMENLPQIPYMYKEPESSDVSDESQPPSTGIHKKTNSANDKKLKVKDDAAEEGSVSNEMTDEDKQTWK